MTDARLKISNADRDQRSDPRASRAVEQDRDINENREYSEAERVKMFRNRMMNGSLPDLPVIPGFRTIWLSTTNQQDSLRSRMSLGYQPIRAEELPPVWKNTARTDGEWAGCVAVNEMIACKLPENLWNAYMKDAHHDAPNEEDEALKNNLRALKQGELDAADMRTTDIGDGTEEILRSRARKPMFN